MSGSIHWAGDGSSCSVTRKFSIIKKISDQQKTPQIFLAGPLAKPAEKLMALFVRFKSLGRGRQELLRNEKSSDHQEQHQDIR
ncbi:MAG: hypothetical protein GTO53_03400 [Planctomycetales bacterium]|nr:hypothetical protein [Planctomycetales bacterium]NIM08211.1 hypothetical protein [Planctomycetales bacterium]NIN07705.1 hypothetical protein [Planctomycetales bacterium]NIN76831.1 hypothetical protein [Planctomycetales bacterium]NIO34027.1 hypothetical protein [Planctomycetales bacterium]